MRDSKYIDSPVELKWFTIRVKLPKDKLFKHDFNMLLGYKSGLVEMLKIFNLSRKCSNATTMPHSACEDFTLWDWNGKSDDEY